MRDTDRAMAGSPSKSTRTSRGATEQRAARPSTLGELRAQGYVSRSVKDELRANLLRRLASEEPIFAGIIGYDETVIPLSRTRSSQARTSVSSESAARQRLGWQDF